MRIFYFRKIQRSIKDLLFSEIISFLNPTHFIASKKVEITKLIVDSRVSGNMGGAVFFPLKTDKRDGHDFITDAYGKGIRNFIVEKDDNEILRSGCNYCVVESSLGALQSIATKHREKFHFDFAAITGSNGKTIVKEWLSEILSSKFITVKSPKSYNSQIGVPLSVWQINSDHEVGVFEAGISKIGEMEKLHSIIQPSIGILTNIGSAHDEGFDSREQKLKEKLELFRNCQKLIVRENEKQIVERFSKELNIGEVISWGSSRDNSLNVIYESISNGTVIEIGEDKFEVSFSDAASLENITHSIIAARILKCEKQLINTALKSIHSVPMRLEVKEAENNSIIIDDTYNHDLEGLNVALGYLSGQYSGYKKSIIVSEIHQSGLSTLDQVKRLDTLLSTLDLNRVILVGKNLIQHRSYFPDHYHFFQDTEETISYLKDHSFNDTVVLITGARQYRFERLVRQLEKKVHGTRLEINLSALSNNLNVFRRMIKPETKMMVMVKAFAYGVGSREVANFLQFNQVDYLGVAYASEGVTLRKLGVNIPIFVMNPSPETLANCFEHNLEPEIFSFHSLNQFLEESKRQKKSLPIHINIDTGMKRLGFVEEDLDKLVRLISDNELQLASVFSHLASSDEDRDFTLSQIQNFEEAFDLIISKTGQNPLKHVLNSAGIVNFPEFQFDMVRLGIGLYGVNNAGMKNNPLQPIGKLVSEISQIKKISKSETIGYGRMGKLDGEGRIATIPIGYADGFSRIYSNRRGKVLINGKLAEVVGNVCMDMIMVDISDINAKEGDQVILFGEGLPIEDLAEWGETIPYEILTNVSERVKRLYFND